MANPDRLCGGATTSAASPGGEATEGATSLQLADDLYIVFWIKAKGSRRSLARNDYQLAGVNSMPMLIPGSNTL